MLDLKQPPSHPLVAASILSADFADMGADCERVLHLGADLLHLDVMDGHFVGNLTMGADMIAALRRRLPEVFLDTHLMVDHPAMYIEPFAKAGANHFSFHLEVCDPVRARHAHVGALIKSIHDHGMTAGLVVNPLTDIQGVEPYLDQLDLLLVMSVHPGKSGQSFLPETLEKTRWLAHHVGLDTRIQMDGGLNPYTAVDAAAAGCDVMVTASALFGAEDPQGVIDAFHAAPIGRS